MEKTLIIGYGNPDREDDGLAWHVQNRLAGKLGLLDDLNPDITYLSKNGQLDFIFTLQLFPDHAADLAEYDRVCFIDAHTGNISSDIEVSHITGQFTQSPLTHHMQPATVLDLCTKIYQREPETLMVSVRGYSFGFNCSLSPLSASLVSQAVDRIYQWLFTGAIQDPNDQIINQ